MEAQEARQRLEEERGRLQHVRGAFAADHFDEESADESSAELSHMDQHQADAGSDTFEREKDFSILERIEEELRDVERAMKRLDDGTYGSCERCGEQIGDDRLEAMPAARFCIEHQHLAEATGPGSL